MSCDVFMFCFIQICTGKQVGNGDVPTTRTPRPAGTGNSKVKDAQFSDEVHPASH